MPVEIIVMTPASQMRKLRAGENLGVERIHTCLIVWSWWVAGVGILPQDWWTRGPCLCPMLLPPSGMWSIQPLHLSLSLPGSTQFIKGNLCTQLVSHLSQGWEKGSGKEIKSCTFSKPDAATFEVKVTITSINEDRGIWTPRWGWHWLIQAIWRTCHWAGERASPPDFKPRPFAKHCVRAKLLQACPTLCDPTDYSLLSSYVHGILQARKLEWVAMPSCTLS